jgi:hypothetical protein
MFPLQQNGRTRGWNKFCPEVGKGKGEGRGPGEEVRLAQTMYSLFECKNNKIKGKKKEKN